MSISNVVWHFSHTFWNLFHSGVARITGDKLFFWVPRGSEVRGGPSEFYEHVIEFCVIRRCITLKNILLIFFLFYLALVCKHIYLATYNLFTILSHFYILFLILSFISYIHTILYTSIYNYYMRHIKRFEPGTLVYSRSATCHPMAFT